MMIVPTAQGAYFTVIGDTTDEIATYLVDKGHSVYSFGSIDDLDPSALDQSTGVMLLNGPGSQLLTDYVSAGGRLVTEVGPSLEWAADNGLLSYDVLDQLQGSGMSLAMTELGLSGGLNRDIGAPAAHADVQGLVEYLQVKPTEDTHLLAHMPNLDWVTLVIGSQHGSGWTLATLFSLQPDVVPPTAVGKQLWLNMLQFSPESIWTGASNDLWSNSANWLGNGLPTQGSDVAIGYSVITSIDNDQPDVALGNLRLREDAQTSDIRTDVTLQDGGSFRNDAPGTSFSILGTLNLEGNATFNAAEGALYAFKIKAQKNDAVLTIAGVNSTHLYEGLAGGLSIEKKDIGDLQLHNAAYYTGGTTLTGGTIGVHTSQSLGSGTLTVKGNSTDAQTLSFEQDNLDIANNINLATTFAIMVDDADRQAAISGAITGNGILHKNGQGTLILSGENSLYGGTVLNEGTLVAAHNKAMGNTTLILAGDEDNDRTLRLLDGITLTNNVLVNEEANVDVAADESAKLGGLVSGAGDLVKVGQGKLIFSRANTLSGDIELVEGTVRLEGVNSSLGTGSFRSGGGGDDNQLELGDGVVMTNRINVDRPLTIRIDGQDKAATTGLLVTGGDTAVTKVGSGHWFLHNETTYLNTAITLQEGSMQFGAQVTNPNASVNVVGGQMQGAYGGYNLTVGQDGVVSPGFQHYTTVASVATPTQDIATLTVFNTFRLDGGRWDVQIDDQGQADRITADNAELVSGTIHLIPLEAITQAHVYTLLWTLDGITGSIEDLETTVSDDTLLLKYELVIEGNELLLKTDVAGSFEEAGSQSSQSGASKTGKALDDAIDNGRNAPELGQLQSLPDGQVLKSLEQLQPQASQAVTQVLHRQQQQMHQSWGARVNESHSAIRNARRITQDMWLAQAPDAQTNDAATAAAVQLVQDGQVVVGQPVFFARLLNDFGRVDGDRFSSGYSYNGHGADVGVQMMVTDNLLVGGSGSVSFNRLNGRSGSGSAEALALAANVYGSYFGENWHVDLGLSYGRSFNETERPITALSLNAKGDYDSDVYSVHLGGGYVFDVKGWTIEPFASLQYTHVVDESYTETGAGALNLSVSRNATDSLRPAIGVRVGTTLDLNQTMKLRPRVSAAYEYEALDSQVTVDANILGSTFRSQGVDMSRHTFRLGVGGDWQLNKNVDLFVDYTASLNSDWTNHSVNGGVRFKF